MRRTTKLPAQSGSMFGGGGDSGASDPPEAGFSFGGASDAPAFGTASDSNGGGGFSFGDAVGGSATTFGDSAFGASAFGASAFGAASSSSASASDAAAAAPATSFGGAADDSSTGFGGGAAEGAAVAQAAADAPAPATESVFGGFGGFGDAPKATPAADAAPAAASSESAFGGGFGAFGAAPAPADAPAADANATAGSDAGMNFAFGAADPAPTAKATSSKSPPSASASLPPTTSLGAGGFGAAFGADNNGFSGFGGTSEFGDSKADAKRPSPGRSPSPSSVSPSRFGGVDERGASPAPDPAADNAAIQMTTDGSPIAAAMPAPAPTATALPPPPPGSTLSLPFGVGARAGVAWGSGHQLFFHAHATGEWKRASTSDGRRSAARSATGASASALSGSDLRPVEFRWECQFGDTRTLLTGWHSIFSHIQQHKPTLGEEAAEFLHEQSKRYRAELQAFLEKSVLVLRSSNAAQVLSTHLKEFQISLEEYQNQLSLLEIAKSIWHLFELMYVDPNENITRQLVSWLQTATPPPDTALLAPDSTQWWAALYRLMIQGRAAEAIQLIEDNPSLQYQSKVVADQMVELIARCPSVAVAAASGSGAGSAAGAASYSTAKESDFVQSYENWQNECRALLDDADVCANPSLEQFFQLLLGHEPTLLAFADSYYELIVAHLLFRKPTTTRTDLPWLAEVCLNKFMDAHADPHTGAAPSLTALDELRRLILQNDLPAALQHANTVIDLRWFMAHLVDLLKHAGHMSDAHDQLRLEFGGTLHEYWLVEYAATLMFTPQLWPLSVNYLAVCPTFGRQHLRTLVQSQPLTSDAHALKLAHICDRFGLKPEKDAIFHHRGMTALREKRYGSAVHWFVQCKATSRLAYICDTLAQQLIDARYRAPPAPRGASAARLGLGLGMVDDAEDTEPASDADAKSDADTAAAGDHDAFASAMSAIESVVEHMTVDVGLSHELAFLGKFRDFWVLQKEIETLERTRVRMVALKAASTLPPHANGSANGAGAPFGSGFGNGNGSAAGRGVGGLFAAPQPKPARSHAPPAAPAGYQPSGAEALSSSASSASSLAAAVSGDLNAYETRIRALTRGCLEIAVRLIAFKVAPQRFWLTLLRECMPLLHRPAQPQYFPTPQAAAAAAAATAATAETATPGSSPLLSVADTHTLLAAVQDVAQSHRSAQWMAHSHCSASHVARIRLALLRTLSAAIQQREEHAEQRETDHTRRTFAATAPLAAGINGLAPASNGAFGSPSASSSSAAANLRSPSLVASPDARGFHYALPLPLHSAFVSTPLVGAVRFA